ncbi:MAG: hypothetical protein J6K66_04480 [Clostridia bacterium]|nr:hypothetical protein [Clostridia bacterium]
MKKLKIKHVISLTVLLVMLAVTLVPAFAASTIGCDWNIGTGETHWNGKDNGRIWDLGSPGEKRYNVSILSNRNVSVHGSIFYVNEWSQDTWVTEVRFSGANGAWKGVYFNSIYGHAYYSRITEATGTGANGRTSVTIP